MDVHYLTDKKGHAKAVQIPIKDWKAIKKELEKSSMAKSLKHAFKEIDLIEKGNLKPKSIDQLLNDL